MDNKTPEQINTFPVNNGTQIKASDRTYVVTNMQRRQHPLKAEHIIETHTLVNPLRSRHVGSGKALRRAEKKARRLQRESRERLLRCARTITPEENSTDDETHRPVEATPGPGVARAEA